uniref:Centaurin-gamma-1A (inferred by orthology to a D. melanogaster protein) n=1 Tax=Strongyloides venezuelensis TaxID=75913 RepID=A0A0K0G0K0_STRVS
MTVYGLNGRPLVFSGYNNSTLVTKSSAGITTKFNMNMTIGAGCEEFFINSSSSDDDDDLYSPINRLKNKSLHSVSFYEPSITKKKSSKLETFKSKLSLSKASLVSLKDLFTKTPKDKKKLKTSKLSILGKRSCDKTFYNTPSTDFTPKSVLAKKPRIRIISSEITGPLKRQDAFVNSHEWTISRNVAEMKLGIVGTPHSGKTALVNHFLTGAYSREDSPEGGRFKKQIVLDGQSYLLLLRDDGSVIPGKNFSNWLDGVIFVFNVDSRESFEYIYTFYQAISKHRNMSECPMILVGSLDTISSSSPRVVSEHEARSLAVKIKKCAYYETCATFGLNVENVFKDACSKIVLYRLKVFGSPAIVGGTKNSSSSQYNNQESGQENQNNHYAVPHSSQTLTRGSRSSSRNSCISNNLPEKDRDNRRHSQYISSQNYLNTVRESPSINHKILDKGSSASSIPFIPPLPITKPPSMAPPEYNGIGKNNPIIHDSMEGGSTSTPTTSNNLFPHQQHSSNHKMPTPSSTPNTQRKHRRISNIFHRHHDDKQSPAQMLQNLGGGRAIPIKQGLLYKRSTKSLNKEWKKKYVCLYSDGRLCYHQNLKDYMDKGSQGKEVFLGLATVKLSGRPRPPRVTQRASVAVPSTSGKENLGPLLKTGRYSLAPNDELLASLSNPTLDIPSNGTVSPSAGDGTSGGSDGGDQITSAAGSVSRATGSSIINAISAGSNSVLKKKKGHRRLGSSTKNEEDEDCEFEIICFDQKRWAFCAANAEERDEWVSKIEEQIEKALTENKSEKNEKSSRAHGKKEQIEALHNVPGNDKCADCGTFNPIWASINLGILICIECSGIHRNLGTHISKVRSLELDDWPIEYLAVMRAIGNTFSNKIWEHNAPKDKKPLPDSTRDIKETWIRNKYEQKRFLPAIPVDRTLGRQLFDSIIAKDLYNVLLVLSRCSDKEVNGLYTDYDKRAPIHLACAVGSVEILQLLLWRNANYNVLDANGHSALWYAKNNGHKECVDVLLHNGLEDDYGCNDLPKKTTSPASIDQMIIGSLGSRDFITTTKDDSISLRGVSISRPSIPKYHIDGSLDPKVNYNFNEEDEVNSEIQYRKVYKLN